MPDILEEVLKFLPEKKISISCFEGANIVLYTKDKEFFLDNKGAIKEIVDSIKKRVELRADPSIITDVEKAEAKIKELVDKEAGLSKVTFDPQRAIVILEVEKPGLAIGREGEILKEIKKETLWVPVVRRTPPIRSTVIESIRHVLYENNDYRRKFLNKVGQRIYGGWIREKKHEWIRLTFLGAGRQVGRSCLFLQTPESRVLLDCGVDVAADEDERYPFLDAPEFDIKELDAVILTHPHIDHSGLIPFLYRMGYKGPLYCTAPTRDIAALLALDFIGVTFKQARKALFSSSDIKEMVKHTICLDYEEVTDVTPDVRVTLYPAGHTIGSSLVHLHIGNGLHNLVYSGDFKFLRSRLLEKASAMFPRLETLIIESTYGAKEDTLPPREECEKEMIAIINETIERNGKVLLPTLGVGRAQENMLIIERCMREGLIKQVPVYVQGLVWDITAIHTAYPDFLNLFIRKNIFHRDENPFLSPIFKRVGSQTEQQEVINGGPCIVIATSGMLQGGASLEYFKHFADNPKNSMIFTSYQGKGSLGQRVKGGEKEILMDSEVVKVAMEVHAIDGLSAHAGRGELLRYLYEVEPKPKKVIINHGESTKCLELASTIHKLNGVETVAPRNLEAVRIK